MEKFIKLSKDEMTKINGGSGQQCGDPCEGYTPFYWDGNHVAGGDYVGSCDPGGQCSSCNHLGSGSDSVGTCMVLTWY